VIVRRPRRGVQLLTILGRLGLAAFKGFIVAVILWRVALFTLESKVSPYVEHITIGGGIIFALASLYFIIWPSPLGDTRSWDEIFHVPPPPDPDEQLEEGAPEERDDSRPRG
jgi:hypothetical protein